MNLAVLGLPGTGKGTLGATLVTESQRDRLLGGRWIEFDAGTCLREFAYGGDSPQQVQLQVVLESGGLAPTALMMGLYREWVRKTAATGTHILSSGIPRGDQTTLFLADVAAGAYPCDGLIWLSADMDTLLDRLAGRRTCSDSGCGSIFNTRHAPPAEDGVCDACGAALLVREEDRDPGIMTRRIANNRVKMMGARDAFRDAGLPVHEVDAAGTPDHVYQQVRTIIGRTLHRSRAGHRIVR